MTIPANLQREFDALDGYLKAAREIIRDGHMPDMRGLEKRVALLCGAIEAAKKDIQQECLPKLSAFLANLDLCESDLRASRNTQPQGSKT